MKALAWDDEPLYLGMLGKHLKKLGIKLVTVDSEAAFIDKFVGDERWDFLITDLVRDDYPVHGESDNVGFRLARGIADSHKGKDLPIFVITRHYDRLNAADMRLPPNAIIKSKSSYPGWLAGEIRQELSRRGLFVDGKRVFMIYGREGQAPETGGRVESFLRQEGLTTATIGDDPFRVEILQGLLQKMNECGAIVAICTPDEGTEDHWQPHPNVFLQIGLALGLSRGLHRLIILQQWGPEKRDQAFLHPYLAGVPKIQFEGDVDHHWKPLIHHLRGLGMKM